MKVTAFKADAVFNHAMVFILEIKRFIVLIGQAGFDMANSSPLVVRLNPVVRKNEPF